MQIGIKTEDDASVTSTRDFLMPGMDVVRDGHVEDEDDDDIDVDVLDDVKPLDCSSGSSGSDSVNTSATKSKPEVRILEIF